MDKFECIFRHNDLPWNIKKFVHNQLVKVNLSTDLRLTEPWSKSKWSHTDIRRMKLGMIGAQVRRCSVKRNLFEENVRYAKIFPSAVTSHLLSLPVFRNFSPIFALSSFSRSPRRENSLFPKVFQFWILQQVDVKQSTTFFRHVFVVVRSVQIKFSFVN